MLRTSLLLFCFWCLSVGLFAQLTQWQGKRVFQLENKTTVDKINFSYLLVIDTEALVAANLMASDGADIRIAQDCDGNTVLPHFIEGGVGTATTKIWCLIPALPGGTVQDLYVFYDNPNAQNTSNFEATFPEQLVLTTNDTINNLQTDSVWEYNYIEISEGAIVKFDPNLPTPWQLRLQADKIVIDGALKGDGLGFQGAMNDDGAGPGGGTQEITGGGGGAYGGAGGNGSFGTTPSSAGQGGNPYGTVAGKDVFAGSAGGAAGLVGVSNPGAAGGMPMRLFCQDLTVNGVLSSNGLQGQDTQILYSPGGGAGGGVLIVAEYIQGTGIIAANGGRGGNSTAIYYAGGGAGGGRVKLFYGESYSFNGSTQVNGGAAGMGGITPAEPGENGSVHIEKEPAAFALRSLDTAFTLQQIEATTCVGDTAAVAVNSGGLQYGFYRDGVLLQLSSDTVFRFPTTKTAQRIICRVTDAGCTRETNVVLIHSNALPQPQLQSNAPGFCDGDSVLLSTTAINGSTNEWLLNGSPVFADISQTYVRQPGNYTIRETTSVGCVGVSNTLAIEEYPLPEPNLFQDGPYGFCAGDSLVLNATQTEDHRIFWKRTGLTQATDTSVFVINRPGSYSLHYISEKGCEGEPLSFTVNQNPLPDVAILVEGGTFICGSSNNSLRLIQQNNVASFRWFRDGVRISDEEQISIQDAGEYWLEALSPGACKAISEKIDFTLFPQALIDTVTTHEFCVGERVELAANDLPGLAYQWIRNGVPIAGAEGQTQSFTNAGFVQVAIAAENGCESTSPPVELFRYSVPSKPVITDRNDTLFAGVAADAFRWFLNGDFLIQTQEPFLFPESSGSYTVVAVNQNLCISDTADSVDFIHPTRVSEYLEHLGVQIYPNPARGTCYMKSTQMVDWILQTLSGQVVLSGTLGPREQQAMQPGEIGYYILRIRTTDSKWVAYPIVFTGGE